MIYYTVSIFKTAKSTIDNHYATIIVGFVQLFGTVSSGFLVPFNFHKVEETRWHQFLMINQFAGGPIWPSFLDVQLSGCYDRFASVDGFLFLFAKFMGRRRSVGKSRLAPAPVPHRLLCRIFWRNGQRPVYHHGRTLSASLSLSFKFHMFLFQSFLHVCGRAQFSRYAGDDRQAGNLLVFRVLHFSEQSICFLLPPGD